MGAAPSRKLRVDAQDNRDRIVEVARRLFATRGLEVTMREIARRSGVGLATLHRHFATREELLAAASGEQASLCRGALEAALHDPDPWRGFARTIEMVCATDGLDRRFTSVYVTGAGEDRVRAELEGAFAQVTRRAKESGDLRRDFTQDDLTLLFQATGAVTAGPAHSRRLVSLLLRSLRA